MPTSSLTSPAYHSEWDQQRNGTFSFVGYTRPEANGPVPNTVPTDGAMSQYDWYECLEVLVWFQPANGAAPTNVGSLTASILRRDRIRGRFCENMSSFVTDESMPSLVSELEEITLDFEFDDLARFPRGQLEKIRSQGLRVWGDELNRGSLAIVESIFVDPPFWRRGLGRRMVQVLVDIVRYKTPDHTVLARPIFLGKKTFDAMERDMGGAALAPAQKQEIVEASAKLPLHFWHAQGLRRIGTSEWLGLSSDGAHPATLIPKDRDAELDLEATYGY